MYLSFLGLPSTIEPQNHRMAWLGSDLRDNLVPILLPWAGTPFSRSDCSKSIQPYLERPQLNHYKELNCSLDSSKYLHMLLCVGNS